MKNKIVIFLALLMLPISGMAANTNLYQRVFIVENLQYGRGIPAANMPLASLDAAGNYAPTNIINLAALQDTSGVTWMTEDRYIWDTSARRRIDANNMTFYDESFVAAAIMTVANRNLRNTGGVITVNWQTLNLIGGWTIDGIPFTTVLTNLTTTSPGVTWTGQGTHTMNIALSPSIYATNGGSATFTSVTTSNLTLNSSTVASMGFGNTNILFAQTQTNLVNLVGLTTNSFLLVSWPNNLPNDSVWRGAVFTNGTAAIYRTALSNPVAVTTNNFRFGYIQTP